jgi:hypothetical protein
VRTLRSIHSRKFLRELARDEWFGVSACFWIRRHVIGSNLPGACRLIRVTENKLPLQNKIGAKEAPNSISDSPLLLRPTGFLVKHASSTVSQSWQAKYGAFDMDK